MATENGYLEKVSARFNAMNVDIEKVKAHVTEVPAEAKIEYQNHLETLQVQQQAVQNSLQELKQASGEDWERLKPKVESALAALQQELTAVEATAQRLGHQSLGWAEGMAKERPHDSEGWAEGLGKRGPGSEGWAEGLGHRVHDSEGWAEGMKKR
jgi:ElaB/YqjD/DUF883 family membrane-anchored ribosome-binding protein